MYSIVSTRISGLLFTGEGSVVRQHEYSDFFVRARVAASAKLFSHKRKGSIQYIIIFDGRRFARGAGARRARSDDGRL